MTDTTVIDFPGQSGPGQSGASSQAETFRDWLSWAECELSILGFELTKSSYDWDTAFKQGLRPEVAAEQAASGLEAG